MMKLIVRKGWRFSCGCEPPAGWIIPGLKGSPGVPTLYSFITGGLAVTLFAGVLDGSLAGRRRQAWLCVGICCVVRVTLSTPAFSPI